MKFGMAGILAIMAIAAVIFAAGCTSAYQQPQQQQQPTGVVKTVEISAAGFNPAMVEINAGDTVIFTNMDNVTHRPASAQHPTHLVYPEPGGCIGSKFDACKDLAPGESWPFTFYQKGEWKYHDHLNCCTNPAFFGTIAVN